MNGKPMKILLAMDTSPASQIALEEVVARPWPRDSSFEVVSVVEPSHLWTTSEVAEAAVYAAEEMVREAVKRLQSKAQQATGATIYGYPKNVILDRAKTFGADFLIVGSHGVSAITRFLLGSVAANVLRHSPCAVGIVRARVRNGGRSNMKVLLATDGSEYSERAVRSVAERPWPTGTEIRVLSAVELTVPALPAFPGPPVIDSVLFESARTEAIKRSKGAIAQAMQILSAIEAKVSESISVAPDTAKLIILDEAARWGADLIVLGSHGSHGVDRFLLGSVSEAVAMHAGCSVEVIRNAG